jgi:hypothetical protein
MNWRDRRVLLTDATVVIGDVRDQRLLYSLDLVLAEDSLQGGA